jgi:hypothetical protein
VSLEAPRPKPKGWGVDIRWARGERGWLEVREPNDGQVYVVWAADCPSWWRQWATVRARVERERPRE